MPFFPSFNRNRKPASAAAEQLASLALEEAEFQRLVERERMRADRAGSSFTLLHFITPKDVAVKLDLVRILDDRLRATDEVGLMADGVAAALPETGRDGAAIVGRGVLEQLPAPHDVTFRVLIHPDTPDEGDSPQPPASRETGATQGGAKVAVPPLPAAPQNPVDSVQTLFVRPLPRWKRFLDVVGATCGLICAMPILLVAALAIRLTSPGPILFRQLRAGLGGRPFTILKLRTMHVDAEAQKAALRAQSEQDGPAFKLRHDPRITRIGWYLRKTCIDELPQLWNVLKGEMTLVGPRPLPVDEANGCQSWERRRLEVTPGLTCIWQVHGGVRVTFAEWMRMDIRYMKTRTILQDVKLIWQTFIKVLFHRASH